MLFHVVSCCFMLFHVVSCCFMLFHVVSCCFMLFLCSVQMQGRCLNGQGHTLVFHRLEQAHGSNCISHLDTGLKHKRSYCTVLSPGIEHASSDTLKIACDLYLSVASLWPSSDLCPQKEQLCPNSFPPSLQIPLVFSWP